MSRRWPTMLGPGQSSFPGFSPPIPRRKIKRRPKVKPVPREPSIVEAFREARDRQQIV